MLRLRAFLMILILLRSDFSFSQSRDLNFYLSAAIQNSPLLKDYSNQYQLKRIDSLLILAGRKIIITGTGEILIAPIINGYGYDEAITNEGQYTAIVGVK